MTTLRKKILRFKIQKIATNSNFVLFFQHNNIKNKQWTFLKNQILNLQNTSIMVCNNKLTYKFYKHITNTCCQSIGTYCKNDNHNTVISKQGEKNAIHFFCQGPTVIIKFKFIYECKIICDVLNMFKYNFIYGNKEKSYVNLKYDKMNLNSFLISIQTPAIFNQRKQYLDLVTKRALHRRQNTSTKHLLSSCIDFSQQRQSVMPENPFFDNIVTPDFFFVGGFAENQIIDHLDLQVLYNLISKTPCLPNIFLYSNLIEKLYSPVKLLLVVSLFVKIKFLKYFAYNKSLINILKIRKKTLKVF